MCNTDCPIIELYLTVSLFDSSNSQIRLVIEEALNFLPTHSKTVITPKGSFVIPYFFSIPIISHKNVFVIQNKKLPIYLT